MRVDLLGVLIYPNAALTAESDTGPLSYDPQFYNLYITICILQFIYYNLYIIFVDKQFHESTKKSVSD